MISGGGCPPPEIVGGGDGSVILHTLLKGDLADNRSCCTLGAQVGVLSDGAIAVVISCHRLQPEPKDREEVQDAGAYHVA